MGHDRSELLDLPELRRHGIRAGGARRPATRRNQQVGLACFGRKRQQAPLQHARFPPHAEEGGILRRPRITDAAFSAPLAENLDEEQLAIYDLLMRPAPELTEAEKAEVKKVAGSGFNVPEPPKNAKREYYLRLEEEQKERNRIAYQKGNGLSILQEHQIGLVDLHGVSVVDAS